MGPCNLEIHEIRIILVKSMDLMAIWMNKFLSGEFHVFRGKMVIIWLSPWVSWAIWTNKFLSGEFRVFCGKWSLLALGVAMEIWQ